MSGIKWTPRDRRMLDELRQFLMARYGEVRPPTVSRTVRWALGAARRVAKRYPKGR